MSPFGRARRADTTRPEASTRSASSVRPDATVPSPISDDDLHWFNEGTHLRLWEKLGAHPMRNRAGDDGVHFAVWAPNARRVTVIGTFNGWDHHAPDGALQPRGVSGIWETWVAGASVGDAYKFHIVPRGAEHGTDKADPYAVHAETPPHTASKVWQPEHDWQDADWMAQRGQRNTLDAPISIYELHLGSWRHVLEGERSRPITYREIAEPLIDHVTRLGFTHVEFLPLTEHPFYGSWGYQTTGYFAASSRYGPPEDLMWLIDRLHQAGIGVILDWVPSHFPTDDVALGAFDGTSCYEHADPRQGFQPDWKSLVFNYGRPEVVAFLLSSAMYWLERFHVDGLRVDAVASMLYLDYSRADGEWIPNVHGGNENLEAIAFLRRFNEEVYARFPDVQTFAEESTAWPMVSRPTSAGGLGFGLKWDLGWMHDTLAVFGREPVHRRYHHDQLTFRSLYAYAENYCLPLSHDEVVHGKGSLLGRMPGDAWQQAAGLRTLFAYQFTTPGKKLVFMGGEFGQPSEWAHERSLDWHLLDDPRHAGILASVADLAHCYRDIPALHEGDCEPFGFEWIDGQDAEQSVISFLRRARDGSCALIVANLTPVPREGYRIGVPNGGVWTERFNSDAHEYGGSGVGNLGAVSAEHVPFHDRSHSIVLTLPPLAVEIFIPEIGATSPVTAH